jgi:DNA-binding MarR family transcriptional regulator/GNAT superfamily N-acetyltransferase
MLDLSTDPATELDKRVAAVRRFNRFYTRRIGLLQRGYLKSALSLAEIRVLYEIAHRDRPTATEIGRDLELDAGYLSRMLAGFSARGLIRKTPSQQDARQSHLALTAQGEQTYAPLERRSHQEIAQMLGILGAEDQTRIAAAMETIETLLTPTAAPTPAWSLRPHRPGDLGWVVSRHASLYAQEYGWDSSFEALVADIVSAFLKTFDPRGERAWIAEMDGEPVGSVVLVRQSDAVAKLRLLIVDPKARGRGVGRRLVEECIGFARSVGYRRITLWTHSILTSARHIYETAGFRLVASAPHASFGQELTGETWELTL